MKTDPVIARLTQRRDALNIAIAELTTSRDCSPTTETPKRRFSDAARKRMSAGMRKYWKRRKNGRATTTETK